MRFWLLFPFCCLFACSPKVPEEINGYVMVEAESYLKQTQDDIRRWEIIDSDSPKKNLVDPDESHHETASGRAYLEALPDTRVTHDDVLTPGVNFSNEPGKMAIVDYKIKFNTPGRYYVWVRAFSSGAEDNGIHVGLNGEWPESGQRMQWCEGKKQWTWDSKQRTKEVHCGEEKLLYLDIPEAGVHKISFSLREDGFEFDAFVLSQAYVSPDNRP
ncbi:hypothetical protein [Neolewinella persica]|uniref:hypothetical protein n=1 Tax=Neolewinella persica TaxID=70998 RepID=UPI00037D1894|nr:hypothetical protein [Neolewinella persica]